MSSKKRVLVVPGDLVYNTVRANEFKQKYDVTVLQKVPEQKELPGVLKEYDAILSREHLKIDEDLVKHLDKTKIIARQGAGYDEIDVKSVASRGIMVTNTPNVIAPATADIALSHLLNITRRFSEAERWLREGNFTGGWSKFMGTHPEGKVLGILGMGSIGKELAKRAAAIGLKVIYHNRNKLKEEEERKCGNASYVSKDELLAKSDYISVNVFVSEATKHILNTSDFTKMKTGVYIINTSRGITINEQALVDALRSGKVAGAGLDVFEREPLVHPDLKTFPNVSLTPHIGTATYDTRRQMEELALDNIEAVLDGKQPLTPVPECAHLVNRSKL